MTESKTANPCGRVTPAGEGRSRAVIENVSPAVDGGRFPSKRVVGEEVVVEADCFADGHDAVRCLVHVRRAPDASGGASREGVRQEALDQASARTATDRVPGTWRDLEMVPLGNDRWRAAFTVDAVGEYHYRVSAWVDPFATWRRDLRRKHEAGQEVSLDLVAGAALVEDAAERAVSCSPTASRRDPRGDAERPGELEPAPDANAAGDDRRALDAFARRLRSADTLDRRVEAALHPDLARLMARWGGRPHVVRSESELRVSVERPRARYSTWYEMFPRSASADPDRPGTLRDVEARLPYVAGMGFDVLYLPPIHPIGHGHRKGRNGALMARPDDPGSPWAIGSAAGGHTSIDPALGTLEDFHRLIAAARGHGLEVAMDLAFQCAPDHPWVRAHPEWFRRRADGSIQHAENPPKKYEDIVPFDFESEAWPSLWQALGAVVEFWIGHGVRVFRVDNPHTKPFAFWEWLIAETRRRTPDVLFLAEAFTRPRVMHRLAKVGFSQSYTYFAWRNEPAGLRQYFEELTASPLADFFRPNVWPNTPDILTEYLQHGGRPAATVRLVLAATLAASYGIYGPPFELLESKPRHAGSEEYLDSEKYQRRVWDLDAPDSLCSLVTRLNRIRRENPALQQDRTLRFHEVDNPALIAYSKVANARQDAGQPSDDAAGSNVIVSVVNTNAFATESGNVRLDLEALGIGDEPYQLHDLLSGARYFRRGPDLYVILDPGVMPAHVLRVRRRVRGEQDFEYYL